MARISKTQTHAICWLNYKNFSNEKIASELGLNIEQALLTAGTSTIGFLLVLVRILDIAAFIESTFRYIKYPPPATIADRPLPNSIGVRPETLPLYSKYEP